ncbi:urease accessory protein UreD [Polycladomyces sp. WAk]|uniref:Urease accessory protein UreD n=1 Tax=Polycladomyces zharkentensis TaxID=2807616 RepID=A0ABS2WL44_9BACL|nr:urease accessory protein UreD [Polycladomyces sp. WAk]MBN2910176.1 urease accessory protein UreD [Polycladomyces sp. WAk]
MGSWTGYLRAVFSQKGERSVLRDAYFEGALKITKPVYLDETGQACVYLMNPGGGYLGGDSYRMEVFLEAGAEVLLTTQSSTKVYKTPRRPVLQETELNLKKGSFLEYVPDPVIAYPHARFAQRTIVRMEPGASLVCTEVLTPGWAPDGSRFRYDLLQSRMDVYMEDQLVLFDHVKLEPDRDMPGLGYMEGFTHLGSLVVIQEGIDDSFIDRIHRLLEPFSEVKIGLSLLMVPGLALRVLAQRTQDVESIFDLCRGILRENRWGATTVFLRKY